jgi:hypothetical protein
MMSGHDLTRRGGGGARGRSKIACYDTEWKTNVRMSAAKVRLIKLCSHSL